MPGSLAPAPHQTTELFYLPMALQCRAAPGVVLESPPPALGCCGSGPLGMGSCHATPDIQARPLPPPPRRDRECCRGVGVRGLVKDRMDLGRSVGCSSPRTTEVASLDRRDTLNAMIPSQPGIGAVLVQSFIRGVPACAKFSMSSGSCVSSFPVDWGHGKNMCS